MLLAVDIGNTNIRFGIFEGNADLMTCSFAIASSPVRTTDEYYFIIKQMLSEFSGIFPDRSVISSVVPSITDRIAAAVSKLCNKEPFMIGSGTRTGFPINIDIQSQLGADIVSNTAYAFELANPPFIIVDLGTATTVTAVDSERRLLGTAIIPGAAVSLNALSSECALLTDVSLKRPKSIIGKNSQDSICCGSFLSHVYAIDGFVREIRNMLCNSSKECVLLGTGGLADVILPSCENRFFIINDMTLRGAAQLFYNNTAR